MKKILVVSIGLIMAVSAQAGLYRWVDDAGNVHFSDKVPAAASKKSHTKFNKSDKVSGCFIRIRKCSDPDPDRKCVRTTQNPLNLTRFRAAASEFENGQIHTRTEKVSEW